MKEIHQFLPGFTLGDAISNHALILRKMFRNWGCKSDIYAVEKNVHPELKEEVAEYQSYASVSPHDIAIYHFSIGSELTEYFREIPAKRVIVYHNITPPHFLDGYNISLKEELIQGRRELHSLKNFVDLALADSEYNRQELEDAGFRYTETFPILIDFEKYHTVFNHEILNKYKNGTNIIFVGRVIPNKRQEDLLKVFYFYQRYFNPDSGLFLIGSSQGLELYYRQILRMAFKMRLRNVIAPGHVPDHDLFAYYRASHMFLSMSEHEGFCVPLLEAMHYKIPVIAFKAGGVPHTLGQAGLLIKEKRFEDVAALIDIVMRNEELRKRIVLKQLDRLDEMLQSRWEGNLKKILLGNI